MADPIVKYQIGVPVVDSFLHPVHNGHVFIPIVVDSLTGRAYSRISSGVVLIGGIGTPADNETPSGTINGTDGTDGNAAFTLAHAPNPAASLVLAKTDIGTAIMLIGGIHYNLAGLTITYTSGNIPIVGQTHRAWYRY